LRNAARERESLKREPRRPRLPGLFCVRTPFVFLASIPVIATGVVAAASSLLLADVIFAAVIVLVAVVAFLA
jgi:hypothetical protein